MGGKWENSSEELIVQFHDCMEDFPNIDRKKMFGYPCCFINNNMFTGLHEQNWIVRLPEELRLELINTYHAKQFEPMKGRPMREYIILPPKIVASPNELREWIKKSLDFASSLPPKIPKKKRKK